MSRLPHPPLLVVTNRHQAVHGLPEIAEQAFAAGCRWLSLREKDLPIAGLADIVAAIRPSALRHGARLGIHGDATMALEVGLDCVHLASGSDAAVARNILGPRALIGISVHTLAGVRGLDPAHVDYVIAGPAFITSSKPGYGPQLGTAGIEAIVRESPVPVIAIGGIDMHSADALRNTGAAGIAVMGSIMRALSPGDQVRQMLW